MRDRSPEKDFLLIEHIDVAQVRISDDNGQVLQLSINAPTLSAAPRNVSVRNRRTLRTWEASAMKFVAKANGLAGSRSRN